MMESGRVPRSYMQKRKELPDIIHKIEPGSKNQVELFILHSSTGSLKENETEDILPI